MSPPALLLEGVSYRYPSAADWTVSALNLVVAPGELVLLTGPTGCGKSTLLRLAAGLLQRHGRGDFQGRVAVSGLDPATAAPSARVRALGFVAQEPGDQLVAGTLGDEVAFGMESAGFSPAEMEARVPALLAAAGLALSPEHPTDALSGGQVQRLTTAAALAAGAGLLLLDEPLAQLDPAGASALMARLRALASRGVGVLMVEHRLESCLAQVDRVDRIALMDGGRMVADAPAAELRPGSALLTAIRELGLTVPGMLDLADRLAPDSPAALRWPAPGAAAGAAAGPPAPAGSSGPVIARCEGLRFRYPGASADALAGVSLAVRAGERLALIGGNGAGKSTLLGALSGALPAAGCAVDGSLVAVPQDPDLALFCATVRAELAYGPTESRLSAAAAEDRVRAAAAATSISALMDRAPQALSRGQRLRVAVAAALSCAPRLLLLDEPTSGQDSAHVEAMMTALRSALSDGALIFATHDIDLALRHATRVVALRDGRVIADAPPGQALASLPPDAPIHLPPLARFCIERGLPPQSAASLASLARPRER